MRLFRQIVKKKFLKHLEKLANRKNDYWDFFMAHNLIRSLNGNKLSSSEMSEVNFNWRISLTSENPERNLIAIEGFTHNNLSLITEFLRETEALEETETKYTGIYEKGKGIVGVLSYDYN